MAVASMGPREAASANGRPFPRGASSYKQAIRRLVSYQRKIDAQTLEQHPRVTHRQSLAPATYGTDQPSGCDAIFRYPPASLNSVRIVQCRRKVSLAFMCPTYRRVGPTTPSRSTLEQLVSRLQLRAISNRTEVTRQAVRQFRGSL